MSNPLTDRITWDFAYHKPGPIAVEAHENIRGSFKMMACIVLDTVPAGREQAIVLTKLEEAMFWANAGIAREFAKLDPSATAQADEGDQKDDK